MPLDKSVTWKMSLGATRRPRNRIARGTRTSYAPLPQRGEIWLVEFPEDPKSRPALIVFTDVRNELATSVLAVPITTNLRPAPTLVLLPAGTGGLTYDAMERWENVSYLHKSRLAQGALNGAIDAVTLREVER